MAFVRDGVLAARCFEGRRPRAPRRLSDLRLNPDAVGAVSRARSAGFFTLGWVDADAVDAPFWARAALEARLATALRLDAVETASADAGGRRRAPKAGLLEDAALAHRLDLAESWAIVDTVDQAAAAIDAGCRAALVDRHDASRGALPSGVRVVDTLSAAVDLVAPRTRAAHRPEACVGPAEPRPVLA